MSDQRLAELRSLFAGHTDGAVDRLVNEILAEVDRLRVENAEMRAGRDEARDWVRRLTATERVLTCAFCGETYPPGTPESNHESLTAHVKICKKHPLATESADLRVALREALEEWDCASQYKGEYLRDKHDDVARIAELRKRLGLEGT